LLAGAGVLAVDGDPDAAGGGAMRLKRLAAVPLKRKVSLAPG